MVEKKKSGYWLTHLGLILGVLFIFFPVWLTFVASTVTQDAIIQPPLPIIPGGEFFENYIYHSLFIENFWNLEN